MTRKDAVTPELRLEVLRRDRGCVAQKIDAYAGECRDRWGSPVVVIRRAGTDELLDYGALTLDHVRDQPMMGKRAPSDRLHLVSLCWHHHLDGWATSHRPELREYLARVEGATT